MTWLSADRIHDGKKWLPRNTALEIDESGTIINVCVQRDCEDIIHYEGTLCPGFVNAHCHVELSHLKGSIPEHSGLVGFLLDVMRKRNHFTDEEKLVASKKAIVEMMENGIVAVGDIANTTDTLVLRNIGNLHWYTFIESIGFSEDKADFNFKNALNTWTAFEQQTSGCKILKQAIVPHAPYSVSSTLFKIIANHQLGATLSVHNQESDQENLYYHSKSGTFSTFFKEIGIDDGLFLPTGKSSLKTYSEWLSVASPLLLVHNTFSNKEDIEFVKNKFDHLFWCLCPNANLFIEQQLPDINLLDNSDLILCIGTDSLASNYQLSVMSELKTIDAYFPEIGWEKLLKWATYNGACALQMQEKIGSFELGKTPGILWLDKNLNVQKLY